MKIKRTKKFKKYLVKGIEKYGKPCQEILKLEEDTYTVTKHCKVIHIILLRDKES